MVDQQRLLGFRPDLLSGASVEPADPASIDIELGEIAAAVMRREKLGELVLGDKARAALAARLERAQAARGAKLVRAAGEAIPCAGAPAVTPDTVWSGDYTTLVELVRIGLFRLNTDAYFLGSPSTYHCGPRGFLDKHLVLQHPRRNGRTHEQP